MQVTTKTGSILALISLIKSQHNKRSVFIFMNVMSKEDMS